MGFWENLRKHRELVEKHKYIELGDALIYSSETEYLVGKLYRRPARGYVLISDEWEITCYMKEIRLVTTFEQEIWLKLFGHGWYFKKEDGVFIARHIR